MVIIYKHEKIHNSFVFQDSYEEFGISQASDFVRIIKFKLLALGDYKRLLCGEKFV